MGKSGKSCKSGKLYLCIPRKFNMDLPSGGFELSLQLSQEIQLLSEFLQR